MAKPEFSETQFVFGYLNEMYFNQVNYPYLFPTWEFFMFPTPLIEREFPVDFFADYYTHSVYYQFKRSEYIEMSREVREVLEGIPASYLNYYRFKIYNRTTETLGQFEKLIQLARHFPNDLVCYCAPCFHEDFEFHYHFRNRSIISNSVIIECGQFDNPTFQPPSFNINDGLSHFLVYKLGTTVGYLCSDPKEIKIYNAKTRLELVKKQSSKNSLLQTIDLLYEEIYLKEVLKTELQKPSAKNYLDKFYIVRNYLLQYYNIVWQPIFGEL